MLTDSKENLFADLTAEQLACRAQCGADDCFGELVRRFRERLLNFLSRKVSNRDDAEDILQDSFVRAYQNIHSYNSKYRFSTWLYTIALRLAVNYHRDRKRRTLEPGMLEVKPSCDPAKTAADKEENEYLWRMALGLSTNQYDALWLRHVEEMTVREISQAMGKTQVNVKVLLYRARINMARIVKSSQTRDKHEMKLPGIDNSKRNRDVQIKTSSQKVKSGGKPDLAAT